MYLISLMTIKSSVAFLLVELSIAWLKKLSFMYSKRLLVCLQLMTLPSRCWVVKAPSRTRACKHDPCSWSEKAHSTNRFPLMRDLSRHHPQWPLCCAGLEFFLINFLTCSWLLFRKKLFTLNPLLYIEVSPTISPSFPVTSEWPQPWITTLQLWDSPHQVEVMVTI